MSPYKNFLSAAKAYMNSREFLRFLLSAHIAVFALGGLFYALGIFLVNVPSAANIFLYDAFNISNPANISLYDAFVTLGTVLMWAGLLLSLIAEDSMTIAIASGSVAVCSLAAWIVLLARRFPFFFGPLFYFLVFGIICIFTVVKAERFVKMRAAAAVKATVPCARCGSMIPGGVSFCPACGAPNIPRQYAPPVQPPYTPPVQPPYTPPVQPVAPAPEPAAPPEPAASAEEEKKKCISCGAELPAGAVFCGKCGTKQ